MGAFLFIKETPTLLCNFMYEAALDEITFHIGKL